MASSQRWSFRLVILLAFAGIQVSAYSIQYCSSLNTASNQAGNYSIYQSNGLCANFCSGDAFALVQGHLCWCSDYVPGTTSDTSDCSVPCPGYPDDLCGNEAQGLYGYLALGPDPAGTQGGSASSSHQTTSPPAAAVTVTKAPDPVTIVVTPTPTPSVSSSTRSSSSSSSTFSMKTPSSTNQLTSDTPTTAAPTTPTSESSPDTSTWTPTPVTSLETVTGQVRTVTVTPTAPPNSQNQNPITKSSSGSGLSTGGAVGLTVGLVALVAIICSIVYFCWRKRRQEKEAEFAAGASRRGSSAGLGGTVPSRTMSENSRYVLGTDGRQVVEAWEPSDIPGSRTSRLMPVDQRLDPFAPLYQRGDGSKSRESINTIRDDHDYSRRVHQTGPILRATNPDE